MLSEVSVGSGEQAGSWVHRVGGSGELWLTKDEAPVSISCCVCLWDLPDGFMEGDWRGGRCSFPQESTACRRTREKSPLSPGFRKAPPGRRLWIPVSPSPGQQRELGRRAQLALSLARTASPVRVLGVLLWDVCVVGQRISLPGLRGSKVPQTEWPKTTIWVCKKHLLSY